MSVKELCERFNYPRVIEDHLSKIRRIFERIAPLGVLLTGSTARGELSYFCEGGTLSLWSDYEFIVVVDRRTSAEEQEGVMNSLRELEKDIGRNSRLFHIDVSWVKEERLGKIPTTFRLFEDKTCGIPLLGDSFVLELPEVTLKNLDYGELNEVLIWRLWMMLLHCPRTMLGTRPIPTERFFSFVLSRNALDLGTWALPHDGALVASFGGRLKYITDHLADLGHCRSVSRDLPALLGAWLRGRRRLEFGVSVERLFEEVLECFRHAVEMRARRRSPPIRKFRFNDWKPRRKAYEALVVWKGKGEFLPGLRWLINAKYELQLNTLVDFHSAVGAGLRGDSECARSVLERINRSLGILLPWKDPIVLTRDFAESFCRLRYRFAEFLMAFSRSVGAKREYLNQVLGDGHA